MSSIFRIGTGSTTYHDSTTYYEKQVKMTCEDGTEIIVRFFSPILNGKRMIQEEMKFAFPSEKAKDKLTSEEEFSAFFTVAYNVTVTNCETGEEMVLHVAKKTPVRFYFIAMKYDSSVIQNVWGSLNITNRSKGSDYIGSSGYFEGLCDENLKIKHLNVIIPGLFFRKYSKQTLKSDGECIDTPTVRTAVVKPTLKEDFLSRNPDAKLAWEDPECPNKKGFDELIGARDSLCQLVELYNSPFKIIHGRDMDTINPFNGFKTEHYEDAAAIPTANSYDEYFAAVHKWLDEMTEEVFERLFEMLQNLVPGTDVDQFNQYHETDVSLTNYPAFSKLRGKMWYGELLDALFDHQHNM